MIHKGISYSVKLKTEPSFLNEVDYERKLPIVIGAFEAQSIAIALKRNKTTTL
jgi:bifunctional DNase/RNase